MQPNAVFCYGMKQRNYQTNCLREGSFAGRAIAQALVVALATFFVLSLAAPAAAQVETLFDTSDDPSITVKTFTSSKTTHKTSENGPWATGGNTFYYVAVKMTIEDTGAATQNYTFGQTSNSQNIDTVMIVYNGEFDPLNPNPGSTNATLNPNVFGGKIAFNDDGGVSPAGACGNANYCPVVSANLAGKRDIILVISTYNKGQLLTLPQSFYADGPRAVSFSAAGSPNEPTGLSATPGDTQVTVAFTTPSSDGGNAISNYEYTIDGGTSWTAFAPTDTSSPVTITGLTNGTAYSIGLRAVNSIGSGTASANVAATPFGPPDAPTGLSATPANTQISVAFTPPSNNGGSAITNYEYSTDGGTSWAAFSPTDASSPVVITGLTNGTTYAIGLRAVNAAGSGTAAAIVSSIAADTPNAPLALSATAGDAQVSVAFTPPSNNGGSTITNYEYSTDGGTSWSVFNPTNASSPAVITGLTNGTTYALGLRAVNAAGSGTASANVISTPLAIPNAPTGLSATVGDTQVTVTFTPSSSNGGATITNHEYTTDGGTSWTAFAPADTASPVTITGLVAGTSYSIGLRAVNSVGQGTPSANVTASPKTIPGAPTGLSATPGNTQVSIAFTPPSSDGGSVITNYQYTADDGRSWTAFTPTTIASPGIITGLANGTAYTIGLRAVNAIGPGPTSETLIATPLATPNAPTGLTATPGSTEATIAFTPPSNNGGSAITAYEYTLNGGIDWTAFIPTVTTSPATVTGLTNGSLYTIGLRAVNAVGPGAASTSVAVTPMPNPTTPSAPTDLSAIPGDTQIEVAFSTPANDGGAAITNYEYTFDDGISWAVFNPTIANSPGIITGLTNNVEYTIKLRAVNSVGKGAKSATSVTATPTNGLAPPTAPTSLSAAPGGSQIEIKFTTPVSDGGSAIINYEYTTDGGISWTAMVPATTSSPVIIAGLANGSTYAIGLRAVNAVGPGAGSQTVVTATPLAAPAAPMAFEATPDIDALGGDGQISVEFIPAPDPVGAPITNYQYSLNGGVSWIAFDPPITSSPATITGLTNGVGYNIQLRGVNSVGPGIVSTSAQATPMVAPNAPTNLSATTNATQATVAFTPPSNTGGGAITNYEYSFDDGVTWTAFKRAIIGSPATFTGLTRETTYVARLRAVNAAGSGIASLAVTFSFGSPNSSFKKNKTKILNMVVGDATRGLQSLMTSNRKLMLGARARFIRQNKKPDAGNVALNTDISVANMSFHKSRKKTNQLAFVTTKNERPVACIKLFGCGDPDFDISGSAQLRRGVLSTSGQFIDQDSSEGGSERRLVFGDFDVQHDSKSGSTISTFNGKLLLEKTVNQKTVLGSFLGIETANSNIAGEFTGGRTSWGPSLGGYMVHQLSPGLYADAIMSFYRGNKSIDVSNGVLDLRSNYNTWAATYRASLSGVIERRSFEIWPELSLSHGTNSIDSIGYNANAYGLVGGGTLDAGSIDITKLMLRPEIRIPIDGLALTDYMGLATFAPRLMCEEITTNAPTLYAKNRSCGRGTEYGIVSQSDDGLTEFRSKVIIDNIGDSTRTGISLNFNYQF